MAMATATATATAMETAMETATETAMGTLKDRTAVCRAAVWQGQLRLRVSRGGWRNGSCGASHHETRGRLQSSHLE